MTTSEDITERRRAEQALRESEERYRTLFDGANEGIFVMSDDGILVSLNESFARMHGYSVEQMLHMRLEDLDTPETRALAHERMRRILSGESLTFEVEHYHKDGHVFPLEVSAGLISSGEGHLIQCFHRDVSERKRAEEALRESEERYRSLFEDNHAVMLLIDPRSGAIADANPAACDWYGWSREEMLAMRIDQINTLSDSDIRAEMEAARAKRRRVFSFKHRRADGTIRDVEVYSGPIELGGETLLYSTIHDVTERRKAEGALRAQEEKYRILTESMKDVVWTLDTETLRFLYVSPSVERLRGFTPEEIIAEPMDAALTPEGADHLKGLIRRNIEELAAGSRSFDLYDTEEVEQPCKDGTTVWTEVIAGYRLNERTGHVELRGVTRDITERKKAEEALWKAMADIKTLRGILPICSSCKRIRDDQGNWSQVEVYVRDRTEAEFSHGFCPECLVKLYPEVTRGDGGGPGTRRAAE